MAVLYDARGTVITDATGDPVLDAGPPPPRTVEQILYGMMEGLLPSGWAWPPAMGSTLGALVRALAVALVSVEGDIAALSDEISPAQSVSLLDAYEAVLGTDPCGVDPLEMTQAARQAFDDARWVGSAGVTEGFFRQLAAAVGISIDIEEPEPPVCGEAVCGVDVCGDVDLRFLWIVTLPSTATGLECAFRRNCPPDLTLYFRYGAV